MGKMAFVFPGQGSQQVGMGQAMYEEYKEARQVFEEVDEVLGFSLSTLCFEGPKEKLQQTTYTQPALLTTSMACYEAFKKEGYTPDFVAGHSLGEYTALVVAGSLTLKDAVQTVAHRGKFMEEAVPQGLGAMSAILQLDREVLKRICQKTSRQDHVVEPANFNSPGQVVISGHSQAVDEAGQAMLQAGARQVIHLPVSGPFHCSLMRPASDRLADVLERVAIQNAQIPVISNVTAGVMESATDITTALIKQVYSPVLWEESVRQMVEQGVTTFVEFGQGNVLGRLIKKVDRGVQVLSVQDPTTLKETIATLRGKSDVVG